jgi:hypothetical protein
MLYLLALLGAITMIAVLWVAVGPRRAPASPPRRTLAPDDDPEFLRRLGERRSRPPDELDL